MSTKPTSYNDDKGIISLSLDEIMSDRFSRYAKYIIQDRALPDVRDGLKPVQRRILYAMDKLNLQFEKPPKKSARVVGEVIGKYHPHGDSSVYEALVRMSQAWKLGIPLIDMQGNNGSIDGDSAAAMRYTEVRLAKITKLMLEDLDKNTVSFVPNFDDSEIEPTVLPSYFPNILTNGATGIAAGYATNMPPHNLNEIISAVIRLIEKPTTRLETILNIVKGPDFPTGGVIQGCNGIRDAFAIGRGKLILNSKYKFEGNNLIIEEIPYEVVKQDLVRKIGEVIDSHPNLGIGEVRDETDRSGLRIVIEFSAKANKDLLRKFLFKNTPLSISYNYNNVVIVNKQPKLLGLIPILEAYIAHYRQVLTNKSIYELNEAQRRLEIVLGFIKMVSVLDEVIQIIRNSINRSDAILNLVNAGFGFSELQSTAIVDMRLHRLTSTDVVKLNEEKKHLNEYLKHLKDILNNTDSMSREMVQRLKLVLKNYSMERRTQINDFEESLNVQMKDTLIEKELDIWISRDGYIKVIEPQVTARNDKKVLTRKPNDLWVSSGHISNTSSLLLVSDCGLFYLLPVYKIPISKWKDFGVHVNTISTMPNNEKIIGTFIVPNFNKVSQQLLITTKLGLIKRTSISDLETKINSRGIRIIKLGVDDEIISVELIGSETTHVVLGTKHNSGVMYNLEDIPVQGTVTKGVKAMTLHSEDTIAFAKPINKNSQELVLITKQEEQFNYKRLPSSELPIYMRPKKGVHLFSERKNKKTREIILFGFVVNGDDTLQLLDQNNNIFTQSINKLKSFTIKDLTKPLGFASISDITLDHLPIVKANDAPLQPIDVVDEDFGFVPITKPINKKRERDIVGAVVSKPSRKSKSTVTKNSDSDSELNNLLKDIGNVLKDPKTENKKNPKKSQNLSISKEKKEIDKVIVDKKNLVGTNQSILKNVEIIEKDPKKKIKVTTNLEETLKNEDLEFDFDDFFDIN